MENDKYIVFKSDAFHAWNKARLEGDIHLTILQSLDDAVVIRKQDIFAGPGLHAYAAAIQTGLELLFRQLPPEHEMTLEAAHEIEYLTRLRDFFFEQAVEAEHAEGKKLPD